MNAKTAAAYLPCYREGKCQDSRIAKAARCAEDDEALRERLATQKEFDGQIIAAIHTIEPPENLQQRLAELGGPAVPLRRHVAHPAILCAIAGILLILGFFVYTEIESRADFPGKDGASRMLTQIAGMTGTELEMAKGEAGGMNDWFYMRGFEGYTLPPELAALPVLGARTFKSAGHNVGQVVVETHEAVINVFRASDFGMRLGEEKSWRIFEQEGWVAAVRQREDVCTLVAFRGARPAMEKFIGSLKL